MSLKLLETLHEETLCIQATLESVASVLSHFVNRNIQVESSRKELIQNIFYLDKKKSPSPPTISRLALLYNIITI